MDSVAAKAGRVTTTDAVAAGHPLCKRNSCSCGYSNCCYRDPASRYNGAACLDLCECGCSGSPPADPDPTSTPTPTLTPTSTLTPTPTACPTPPAPTLNSPANDACIATGSYVDLIVNSVNNTCGGNTAEYQIPFTYRGNSYPGAYQDSTTRSTGPVWRNRHSHLVCPGAIF